MVDGWMNGCMHLCMYAYMHVCTYACMHVCMCVCMHACMYVCMYACVHACMYLCTYTQTDTRVSVGVFVCLCLCSGSYSTCVLVLLLSNSILIASPLDQREFFTVGLPYGTLLQNQNFVFKAVRSARLEGMAYFNEALPLNPRAPFMLLGAPCSSPCPPQTPSPTAILTWRALSIIELCLERQELRLATGVVGSLVVVDDLRQYREPCNIRCVSMYGSYTRNYKP